MAIRVIDTQTGTKYDCGDMIDAGLTIRLIDYLRQDQDDSATTA